METNYVLLHQQNAYRYNFLFIFIFLLLFVMCSGSSLEFGAFSMLE